MCLVGANRTIYTVTENACIFFGFAKSRTFGGAPRQTIINRLVCRLCFSAILRYRANKSLSRFSPPSTLGSIRSIFQKEKRPTRDVCLFGAGERARNRHTATGIKTHIFTRFSPIFRHFCVIFYPFSNRLLGGNFEPTSAF